MLDTAFIWTLGGKWNGGCPCDLCYNVYWSVLAQIDCRFDCKYMYYMTCVLVLIYTVKKKSIVNVSFFKVYKWCTYILCTPGLHPLTEGVTERNGTKSTVMG